MNSLEGKYWYLPPIHFLFMHLSALVNKSFCIRKRKENNVIMDRERYSLQEVWSFKSPFPLSLKKIYIKQIIGLDWFNLLVVTPVQHYWFLLQPRPLINRFAHEDKSEVRFVPPVSASDNVKLLPAILISPFSLIFCVFITKNYWN